MPPRSSEISQSVVTPPSSAGFKDVDELRDSSGITAVISQRKRTGELTVAIFRVYVDNDGHPGKTSFIAESMLPAYMSMLQLATKRCEKLRETGELPFPSRR